MMLATDLALVTDDKFKVWAEKYYKDEELWFKDFAMYYQKLNELGCKNLYSEVPWYKFWWPPLWILQILDAILPT